MKTVETLLNSIQVYDVPFTKIRIGNGGDGGYIALKEICDNTTNVYSFGVGDDVGFEVDWIRRYPTSKVYMYDPYVDHTPDKIKNKPQFVFRKQNIVSADFGKMKFIKNALLKIDIEGNEWTAFDNLLATGAINNFTQLLTELHFVHAAVPNNMSPYFQKMYSARIDDLNSQLFLWYSTVLSKLREKFVIFHIHANNSLPPVYVEGHWLPPLLEVSFVNQKFISGHIKKYAGQFPIAGLDVPNKSDRPDIMNYYPLNGHGGSNGIK